jgi:uncharacterized protein with FMN-binding domain
MTRITYWLLGTFSVLVLLFGYDASQRPSTSTPLAALPGSTAGTTTGGSTSASGNGNRSNGTTSSSGNAKTPGSGNTSGSTSSGTRTVTGSTVQTQWGPVQIRLTIVGQKITHVAVLQYPHGNPRDVELANYSLPVLIRETLQSQSASIDMVSGATYTSSGYVQSLQSAIDQANL